MAKLFDRVGQATATTGTGTATLGAVITDATNGDLATFADMGAAAADSVNYLIVDGNNWEIGTGALGGTGPGFTLTRTVAKSKIAGTVGTTALTLSGTAKVYSVPASVVPNAWANGLQVGSPGAADILLKSVGGFSLQVRTGDDAGWSNLKFYSAIAVDSMAIGDGNATFRAKAINIMHQSSGTAAQTLRIYGTTSDDTTDTPVNYSRLSIKHAGGTAGATIATEAGGTGTAGPLTLTSNGLYRLGGATASFPALKINGAELQFRLADDSYWTNIVCGNVSAQGVTAQGGVNINYDLSFLKFGTSLDTALYRNSAGVLEINNGTAGTFRDLNLRNLTASGSISGPTNSFGYIGFIGLGYNNPGELTISNNAVLNWGSVSLGGTDVALGRDAANILGQRNLANAQTFRIYGSTDSTTGAAPTNYSRLSIKHAGGTAGATIATEAGGTGTAGGLTLNPANGGVSILGNAFSQGGLGGWTLRGGFNSSSTHILGFGDGLVGSNLRVKFDANIGIQVAGSYGFPAAGINEATPNDTAMARIAAGVVEIHKGTPGNADGATRAAAYEQTQGTLTDAASIAWDVRAKQSGIVTLGATIGATRALANPTNAVAGTTYILVVKQDATGSRALTYGTQYKWPGGVAPVLSTAANATDVLTFIYDGTNMLGVAQKAFA